MACSTYKGLSQRLQTWTAKTKHARWQGPWGASSGAQLQLGDSTVYCVAWAMTQNINSGLAGPWNRGIIAHQTPHFRRPPKHVNNKGPLVFAQTFCTAWFISLENLHIYSKTYVFSNTFEGFRPKCTFRGCLSKYRRTFIVYMFRRPPEVWSLMSDNALIWGTGKVGMWHMFQLFIPAPQWFIMFNIGSGRVLLSLGR